MVNRTTRQTVWDELRSVPRETLDRISNWKPVWFPLPYTISYRISAHNSPYGKIQKHTPEKNNDSYKRLIFNTDNFKSKDLRLQGNIDTSQKGTHQIAKRTVVATNPITSDPSMVSVPGINCVTNLSERPNSVDYLTYFNCGHVMKIQDYYKDKNFQFNDCTDRSKRIRPLHRSSVAYSTQTLIGDSLSR